MLVKTVKPHSNGYGDTFKKKKGAEYEHPTPAADIARGLVKEVEANDDSENGRVQGNGTASVPAKKQHRKKRGQADDEGGAGTNEGDSDKSSAKGADA